MNLGTLLSVSTMRNPRRTAIVFGDERISYEQLDQSTTALAQWFIEQGCKPGDRVALHWPNSSEMVKLLFACFKAGLIAVPVNVSMKPPEIAYVLAHSKAALCMIHPSLMLGALEATRGCPSLRSVHSSLEEVDERDWTHQLPVVNAHDPTLILYTSGTTARPKGVTHTHKTVLEIIHLFFRMMPEAEAALLMTQLTYVTAICGCLLPAIAHGATTVVMPGFDAPLVLDAIERFRCDFLIGLPSMAQFLLEEQAARPRNVRSLRTVMVAGDSVPPATQERFQSLVGVPIREGYGMTEIGGAICNPEADIRPGSLGKPIAGVEVRIVDQDGRPVPDGQTGEIIVRSPGNFVGYWENPAATAETIRDGWVYTGDFGHRDADGYIWFDGRKKEIIVRGGYNISPQEVEEAISHHPSVLEVAVVGMPVAVHGERVVAFVTLRDGSRAGEQELRDYAGQRLAEIKVPEKIVFVPNLPKGITGKVQRRALKDMPVAAVA